MPISDRFARRRRRSFAAALVFTALAVAVVGWIRSADAEGSSPAVISVSHGGSLGRSLPAGFVGLSFEYSAVPAYAGAPTAINPVLVQLIRNLAPGQRPVLRIGGDSTDQTWWPVRGVVPPRVIDYALTPRWLRVTAGLTRALNARLIVGINLAIDRPALAAAEARALIAGIGRRSIEALEIGNEPDIYELFPAYHNARGAVRHVRGPGYGFGVFMRQFTAVRRALPRIPIAGPALGGLGWASHLGRFVADQPGLRLVTMHLYPLLGPAALGSPWFPTIAHLLSDAASTGLARGAAPSAKLVHRQRLGFRIDEMNSVTSGGKLGISDTFASALWVLETLFAFDQAGVDGVNIHTFPGARYAPFAFTEAGGHWSASVRPAYYGMLMFGRAAPPGSRILPLAALPPGPVKAWATVARDRTIRVLVINQGVSSRPVQLSTPPGASGPATVEQLLGPGLAATTGVTLDGQTFGSSTDTGILAGPAQTAKLSAAAGGYPITLPPTSATMVTWTSPAAGGAAKAPRQRGGTFPHARGFASGAFEFTRAAARVASSSACPLCDHSFATWQRVSTHLRPWSARRTFSPT